jgi:histidinol-phosphatase (PHP family)
MITTNFHTHSVFCDGEGTLLHFIEAAIAKNMTALGFSSHAPLPFDTKWAMKSSDFMSYCQSVQFLKSKYVDDIYLYLGAEVDYIPGVTSPGDSKYRRYNVDYTIGSVHFVGRTDNDEYWDVDWNEEKFEWGLNKIFHGDIKKTVREYYQLITEMTEKAEPSIIGHLDIIKKFNGDERYFAQNDAWYRNLVTQTLDTIAKSKSIVEVNTRGLKTSLTQELYPSPWILKICLEKNIPVTINNDAHKPEELLENSGETAQILREIGFTEYYVMGTTMWKPVPL